MLKARKISVNMPAGVDEGTRIRVAGEGEAGVRGATSGDLYLFVHLKRHGLFERDGSTLIAEAPISFSAAALGGSITRSVRRLRRRGPGAQGAQDQCQHSRRGR